MTQIEKFENALKGIVLIMLAVSGNFIAETFGCQTQKILRENMFAKHLVALCITYFAISFGQSSGVNPTSTMKTTLMVYFMFLLFTKMNLTITLIVFCLVTFSYINYTFVEYYKNAESSSKKNGLDNALMVKRLETLQFVLYISIVVIICAGFVLYTQKQYEEHYHDWSFVKLIFGVSTCKSAEVTFD